MDWHHWRREFPITEHLTHFNHAGIAPLPRRVAAAVKAFIDEATVVDAAVQRRWSIRGEQVRAAFARLVGAQPDEIAFVKNTSEGLSLIAAGLDWQRNDNVIAVDGEYPANIYPWFALRRYGVETRLVRPVRGRVRAEDVAALADAHTRVVSVSFVDWSTGARTDLRPIGTYCRDRGILFCVDGIQGIGALPLDVEREQIDCLAVGGHKWLLAPEGCGGLFISRRVVDRLQSVLHGWKSVQHADTYLPYHFDPRPDAAKFEPGSAPQLGIHALGAAIDIVLEVGVDRIRDRLFALADRLVAGLRVLGAEIVSPWGNEERSGIVVFRLGSNPEGLRDHLTERDFVVRVRNNGIRIAPHFYNNDEDIDRLLTAVGMWLSDEPSGRTRATP